MKINEIKPQVKTILFFILLVLIIFSIKFIFYRTPPSTQNILPSSQKSEEVILVDKTKLPIRIKIPVLNIDTVVEHVGILPDGSMGVPELPSTTAWYSLGTIPGELGSAVVDGHAGYKDGIPAVFDYLYKLHTGDKIYTENSKGEILTFIVKRKENYKEDASAEEIFNSNDDTAHLNLITCSGIWNKKSKNHPERLVIFADLEK